MQFEKYYWNILINLVAVFFTISCQDLSSPQNSQEKVINEEAYRTQPFFLKILQTKSFFKKLEKLFNIGGKRAFNPKTKLIFKLLLKISPRIGTI